MFNFRVVRFKEGLPMTRTYIIAFVVSLVLGIVFLSNLKHFTPEIQAIELYADNSSVLTEEDVSRIRQAIHHVKKDALKEFTKEQLVEFAIKGIYDNVDPHSGYYPAHPEEKEKLNEAIRGMISGVGIEVTADRAGRIVVLDVYEDAPAGKAGVEQKDIIIKVNGEAVIGKKLEDVVKKIRGPTGSPVTITVNRIGVGFIEIPMTRATVIKKVARAKILEPGIGYIKFSSFTLNSAPFLATEILKLKQAAGADPLRGFILDLRRNPGGLVDESVSVSDLFLDSDKEPVVWTRKRGAPAELAGETTPGDILGGAPLVVLVDEMSASASEIVAGALQDYGRARIVGTKTYGKGTMQGVEPQPDGGIARLTVANWLTPKKHLIDDVGIVPDVEILVEDEFEAACKMLAQNKPDDLSVKEPDDVALKAGIAELKRMLNESK